MGSFLSKMWYFRAVGTKHLSNRPKHFVPTARTQAGQRLGYPRFALNRAWQDST